MSINYNVVFACDDKYAKFAAVTMQSIILNLAAKINAKDTFSDEKFIFTLLTNGFSDSTSKKIQNLEEDFNQIFPTKIIVHTLSDDLFVNFKKWSGNYLAYYRLLLSKIFDESTDKVLYLDCDISVACDIRTLFHLEMNNNVFAAVADSLQRNGFKNLTNNTYYYIDKPYFNSGVLLINYKKWLETKIEEKAIAFIKNYDARFPDQDALNSVTSDVLYLQEGYNLISKFSLMQLGANALPISSLLDDTCVELVQKNEQIKIIHYAGQKPWNEYFISPIHSGICTDVVGFATYWWYIAKQTKAFYDDLAQLEKVEVLIRSKETVSQSLAILSKNDFSFFLSTVKQTFPLKLKWFYRYSIENKIKKLFRKKQNTL